MKRRSGRQDIVLNTVFIDLRVEIRRLYVWKFVENGTERTIIRFGGVNSANDGFRSSGCDAPAPRPVRAVEIPQTSSPKVDAESFTLEKVRAQDGVCDVGNDELGEEAPRGLPEDEGDGTLTIRPDDQTVGCGKCRVIGC